MSRAGELAKNTTILFIGQISTKAISFLLLPLYTAYLSEAQYGIVDLISTLIIMFGPLISLEMQQGLFRFMIPHREDSGEIKNMMSTAFLSESVLIATYVFLFLICSYWIHNEYKWFLLSNVIIAVINQFACQSLRGLGQNKDYAITTFLASVSVILLNIIFIVGCRWGAYGMLSATFIGNFIALIYSSIRLKIFSRINLKAFSRPFLRELLRYSLPLIPNELSWWGIRASDRIIVSAFLGLTINGIISVGHRFPEILMTVYTVFGLAWTENIVLHYNEDTGKEYFSHMTNVMIKIFTSLSLIIIATLPFVFHILVNAKFNGAYPLIPLYFIGSNLNIAIGLISVVYIANNETKTIAKTSLLAAIISIVSCIVLIKFIGMYASPASFIIGFGSMLAYRCFDLKRFVKMKWDYAYIIKFILIYAIVGAAYFINNWIYNIVVFIIATIFLWIENRKNITILKQKTLSYFKKRCGSSC